MKKIFNFRIALFTTLSVVLAVLCAYFAVIKSFWWIVFAVVMALMLLAFIFTKFTAKDYKIRLIISAIMCAVFLIGFLNFYFTTLNYKNANLEGHTYTVSGRVDEVYDNDNYSTVIVSSVNLTGVKNGKSNYRISVYLSGENTLKVGDEITFTAPLYDRDLFYEGRFAANNIENKIKYYCYVGIEGVSVNGNYTTLLEKVNLYMRNNLARGLDKEEYGVACGLLLGNSAFMSDEVISNFRYAGVAHIFAVSGLHIGVLATALAFIFKLFKAKSYISVPISVFVLFFYAGICGFSVSSLRAAIMVSVYLIAKAFGLKYDSLTSIGLAATFILCIMPADLFNVGFLLSFTVVIGIVVLSKPIARVLRFLPSKIANSVSAVVSAQLVSIPICLAFFKSVSLIAVLTNILLLPVVSALFVILLVATLISGIGNIQTVVLFVPNYLLKGLIWLINIIDYKIFMVGGIVMGGFSATYYLALLCLSGLINLKKLTLRISALVLALICIGGTVWLSLAERNKYKATFIGSESICMTAISGGGENTVIINDCKTGFALGRIYRLKTTTGIQNIDTLIVYGLEDGKDLQNILTRLNTLFNLNKVYYYGTDDVTLNAVIRASFKSVDACGVLDGAEVITANGNYGFALNGKLLNCKVNGKSVGIFKELAPTDDEYKAQNTFDVLIGLNNLDNLFSANTVREKLSFRTSAKYRDAERRGNLDYLL